MPPVLMDSQEMGFTVTMSTRCVSYVLVSAAAKQIKKALDECFTSFCVSFSASLTRVFLASDVKTLLLAFAVRDALWDTQDQR